MPLAIELAAARVKLLAPDAILARLEHQLSLLAAGSRDLPERQQTLRGAIAWSYDILDETVPAAPRPAVRLRRGHRARRRRGGLWPGIRAGPGRRRRPLLARRPEPDPDDRGHGRAALRRARHDPRVRERDAGAARAAPGAGAPPRRVVRRLRGARGRAAERRRPARRGSRSSSTPTTTSGSRSIAPPRARIRDGDHPRLQRVALLAEARPPLRGAPPPRFDRRDRVVAPRCLSSARGSSRRSAACAGGRATSPAWRRRMPRRSRSGGPWTTRRELANAIYNYSFTFTVPDMVPAELVIDGDPLPPRSRRPRGGARRSFARSATSAARRTCCGAWATCSTSQTRSIPGPRTCASRWRSSERSATARWKPGRCTCWVAPCCGSDRLDEARRDLRQALRVFHDASDAAGITLVFDDLSSQAIADQDLDRAAPAVGRGPEPHDDDRRGSGDVRGRGCRARGPTARPGHPRAGRSRGPRARGRGHDVSTTSSPTPSTCLSKRCEAAPTRLRP